MFLEKRQPNRKEPSDQGYVTQDSQTCRSNEGHMQKWYQTSRSKHLEERKVGA